MADFKKSSQRGGQVNDPIQYNNPWEQVSSDQTAPNAFISGLGLRFKHLMFIPYVIGASDTGSLRNYDEQTVQKKYDHLVYDNNGIYKEAGEVYAIWQGNNKKYAEMPAGYYPGSTATVTVNRNYIDTNNLVGISEFDKFVFVVPEGEDPLEYSMVQWEQIKSNPVGVDRLMFHALKVDMLIDSNGVEYKENVDFYLKQGNIHWTGQNQPGIDNNSGEGVIYGIRYRYVPSFYAISTGHELRSQATFDPQTGVKKVVRGPMMVSLQLDWVFLQALKNQEKQGDSSRNFGDGGNLGPL